MSFHHNPSLSKRILSTLLLFILLWSVDLPVVLCQPASSPALKIVILDGEGAINNIRQRTAREPIVQVEDENRKPVAGALILFTLPDRGPGAVFADGSKTSMVYTDAKGQAVARGLQPNQIAGKYQIKVNASFQGRTASAVINQSNVAMAAAASAAGISAKVIAVLGVLGAATVAGVVMNNRKKQTSASSPAGITVGDPTVGRP